MSLVFFFKENYVIFIPVNMQLIHIGIKLTIWLLGEIIFLKKSKWKQTPLAEKMCVNIYTKIYIMYYLYFNDKSVT